MCVSSAPDSAADGVWTAGDCPPLWVLHRGSRAAWSCGWEAESSGPARAPGRGFAQRNHLHLFSAHCRACAHLWVPPSKLWHSACNWWVHCQPAGAGKGCSGVCRPVPCRAVCLFPCDMRATHITPALQPLPSLVNPPEVNSPAPLPCLQKFPRGAVHAAALSSCSPARWQPAELQPGTASGRRNAARFSLFPAVCSQRVGHGWPGRAEAARSPALGLGPVCSPRCGLHSNPRGQWEPRRSNARRLDRVLWKPGCTPAWPSWLKRPHGFPRRGGGAPTAG